jgi:hypothetical protein
MDQDMPDAKTAEDGVRKRETKRMLDANEDPPRNADLRVSS